MRDVMAHVEDRKSEQKRVPLNVGDVDMGMFGNGGICLLQSGRFRLQAYQLRECGVLHYHADSDGNGASPD